MTLVVDNHDSFTYTIVQYITQLGYKVCVVRNDEMDINELKSLRPERIVISPGPYTPDEAGISLEVVDAFQDRVPILGICLGHQSVGQYFGAKIVQARHIMHGKISMINVVLDSLLFVGIPKHFEATRYHSWVVENHNLPECLRVTALSEDDGEIMALEVRDKPIYGVQFHPESILSKFGKNILSNFLRI